MKLIDHIENVQRRFTKRLPGLHNISCVISLKSCNIELLELCRFHTDLVMLYNILNGLICVNNDNYLTWSISLFRAMCVNLLNIIQD